MKIFSTLLFVLTIIFGIEAKASEFYSLEKAREFIAKNEAIIIDVREDYEVKNGHVKGAKWYPLSKIRNDASLIAKIKNDYSKKKILVYCRSGNRSGMVNDMLKQRGLESYNLGGYSRLHSNGFPQETGEMTCCK